MFAIACQQEVLLSNAAKTKFARVNTSTSSSCVSTDSSHNRRVLDEASTVAIGNSSTLAVSSAIDDVVADTNIDYPLNLEGVINTEEHVAVSTPPVPTDAVHRVVDDAIVCSSIHSTIAVYYVVADLPFSIVYVHQSLAQLNEVSNAKHSNYSKRRDTEQSFIPSQLIIVQWGAIILDKGELFRKRVFI